MTLANAAHNMQNLPSTWEQNIINKRYVTINVNLFQIFLPVNLLKLLQLR